MSDYNLKTPERPDGLLQAVEKLMYWAQISLPAVYGEELTYAKEQGKMAEKINEVVEQLNVNTEWTEYLLNEGVENETIVYINTLVQNGTLGNLINNELLGSIQEQMLTSIQDFENGVTNQINSFDDRLNNFIKQETPASDTELKDIRLEFNGTTQQTAGEAVRNADMLNYNLISNTNAMLFNTDLINLMNGQLTDLNRMELENLSLFGFNLTFTTSATAGNGGYQLIINNENYNEIKSIAGDVTCGASGATIGIWEVTASNAYVRTIGVTNIPANSVNYKFELNNLDVKLTTGDHFLMYVYNSITTFPAGTRINLRNFSINGTSNISEAINDFEVVKNSQYGTDFIDVNNPRNYNTNTNVWTIQDITFKSFTLINTMVIPSGNSGYNIVVNDPKNLHYLDLELNSSNLEYQIGFYEFTKNGTYVNTIEVNVLPRYSKDYHMEFYFKDGIIKQDSNNDIVLLFWNYSKNDNIGQHLSVDIVNINSPNYDKYIPIYNGLISGTNSMSPWSGGENYSTIINDRININFPNSSGNMGYHTPILRTLSNSMLYDLNYSIVSTQPVYVYLMSTKNSDNSTIYVLLNSSTTGNYSETIDLAYYSVYRDCNPENARILFGNSKAPQVFSIYGVRVYESGNTTENVKNNVHESLLNIDSDLQTTKATLNNDVKLVSPNGNVFKLTVNNAGVISGVPVLPTKSLFIGNSLLLGFNEFGMAAPNVNSDYYYHITNYIKSRKASATFDRQSGVGFENQTTKSGATLWIQENLLPILNSDLNMIVIQLGDNVNTNEKINVFKTSCRQILEAIRTACPLANVIWMGEWYATDERQNIIATACNTTGSVFVNIENLNVVGNQAKVGDVITHPDGTTETITNSGVASHPGATGMLAIANRFIEQIFQ